ncbi:MAG: DUF3060 domain-containing protein [Myxococcales bacterium]|nr:DUF3060 domain-containing protein [Myxococcales bacterium]
MRSLVFTSLLLASPAFADGKLVINDNGARLDEDCAGREVVVNGNSASLALRGECKSVKVHGNLNTVQVEAAAKLQVLGNDNRVLWERGAAGKQPAIANLGNRNTVQQGAAPAKGAAVAPPPGEPAGAAVGVGAGDGESVTVSGDKRGGKKTVTVNAGGVSVEVRKSEDSSGKKVVVLGGGVHAASAGGGAGAVISASGIAINQDGLRSTYDCGGANVAINGDHNALTFTGACRNVAVNGDQNSIAIETAAAIAVHGDGNQITWKRGTKGDPSVSMRGDGNDVHRAP